MTKLILMRHGESEWNQRNQFTGWVDVPLSYNGVQEALEGGRKIRDIPIDVIFTSTLIRAHQTTMLAMCVHSSGKVPLVLHEGEGRLEEWSQIYSEEAKAETIPVYRAWELNERYYGELQGLNKQRTREKYGDEQVHIWRRSFGTPPPNGESLKMTAQRTIPYFEEKIVAELKAGRNVFVSAHGNSLRSIIMDLDDLTEEEVVSLELPTGAPILYEYENGKFAKAKV